MRVKCGLYAGYMRVIYDTTTIQYRIRLCLLIVVNKKRAVLGEIYK
jgi:hypothetical protein